MNEYRGSRRRADFEVSRALLATANVALAAHSMSHSSEHAAVLIAPDGWQIGVDLEISRPRDLLKLARFAFHESEVRAMESAAAESRDALFHTLWTLKESFAKALRLDLVDALRECVFWKDGEAWHGRVPTSSPWGAAVFQPRPDIFLATAWIGGSATMPLDQWEWPPKKQVEWPRVARVTPAPSSG
jgi:phosphopantetheinyl transferase